MYLFGQAEFAPDESICARRVGAPVSAAWISSGVCAFRSGLLPIHIGLWRLSGTGASPCLINLVETVRLYAVDSTRQI